MRKSLFILILILAAIATVRAAQDFNIKTRVDVVEVPVSVRDSNGKLVPGLTQDDFSILEDDKPQVISNFSSDLQPLSAAIVIDTGMGGISLRRLVPSFISVTGAFGEEDEMALFRYDHLVRQLSDFTKDPIALEKSFDAVKVLAAKQPATVPAGEPAPTAPKIIQVLLGMVNAGNLGGPPPDPLKPQTGQPTPVPTSRVLFDAVYQAAKSLETRSPDRHRIIFMFSDGQVAGPHEHSLEETVNMLLRDNIELYAVSTDSGAFEGRFSVLSAYAHATGGEVYRGLSTAAMEDAFSKITDEARNKYVIAYHSSNVITDGKPAIRTIQVKVSNPKLKVTNRKGYTQLP